MGDFDRKPAPGKTSGVTADDLVQAPNIGSVAPGKINLVQGRDVGDQWIDHGAVCDGKDMSTQGCFLSDLQRLRLIIEFKDRVQTASTNYKDALLELRVDELMKKEDDLNWVLSLALDLAGAHLVVVAAKALKGLKAAGAAKLADIADRAAYTGTYSDTSWSTRADSALQVVTDARIDGMLKSGFAAAKKPASGALQKGQNRGDESAKQATVSYIAQLQDGCDIAFKAFERQAIGHTNDAELVVLYEGMHERLHTKGTYKTALNEKLKRFRASGVNDIGRKQVLDRRTGYADVHRDTRVVFVQGMHGVKTAWYQSQEGDFNPSVRHVCDPGAPLPKDNNGVCKFGARDPREAARLERAVPDEFKEAAIARSEQKWGPIETIEDPYVSYVKSLGLDVEKMNQPASKQTPPASPVSPPAPSIFANKPPVPWSDPTLDGLPSNSIFSPAAQSTPASSTAPSPQLQSPVESDPFAMFMNTPKVLP
jgi:hypothetical protein